MDRNRQKENPASGKIGWGGTGAKILPELILTQFIYVYMRNKVC